ncbi:hypothetical protein B9479_005711 [Cryptococcus floricola]|uniref:Uncharacterized protein n=1 Tax=Cryptococcus floricola TaxID=2591691 RepID=A0A5D3ASD4_9TREE|nr:hypothetical protein B9479_005711 [Cryptococcus floricola]
MALVQEYTEVFKAIRKNSTNIFSYVDSGYLAPVLSQEESLRDRLPQSTSRSSHSDPPSFNRQNDSSTPSVPRNPCTCGGYHWRKDCPNLPPLANETHSSAPRASSTNNRAPFPSSSGRSDNNQRRDTPKTYVNTTSSSYRPPTGSANATPNQNGNPRAAPTLPPSTVNRSVNAAALTAPRPTVRFEPQPSVIGSVAPSNTAPLAAPPAPSLAPAMTPLYAYGRLNTDSTTARHRRICIDTGAGLSVIDAHYAKEYTPQCQSSATPRPAIELTGLGQADSTSFIVIDVTFTVYRV